jgi:outer membrane lipoprotein-sorting protein
MARQEFLNNLVFPRFLALCLAVIFVAVSPFLFPSFSKAQTASEIIDRMEDAMRGESSYAEMTMTIERPRYSRDVSMKAWSLGNDYSLILITSPARDEGTTYLKRENEIWNYVPTIDRTLKLPPSMMSQSWMGSDFTNDDLVRETTLKDDYSYTILREETHAGREAWVLELIPKPNTPIVWGKVLIWVDKQYTIMLQEEKYDQSDELVSTAEFAEIREMDGRNFPTRMTMIPADEPDHRTIMTYEELEFNIDVEPSFFTRQNMRRVR